MIYDYLIVGGGISGLNTALKLKEKYPDARVHIVERNKRLGGRVYTESIDGHNFDAGAGRFSNTHKRLLKIIKSCDLESKIYKLSNDVDYVITKKYKNVKFDNPNEIINELIKDSKKTKLDLRQLTFKEYCEHVFDSETARFLENSFPYYSEISIINAEEAVRAFEYDLDYSKKFYILLGGLYQIIQCLVQRCKKIGVKFTLGFEVTDCKKNGETFVINDKIKCRRLLVSALMGSFLKTSFFNPIRTQLNSVICKPLYRIYFVYPKSKDTGEVWFKTIKRTITDSRIKYVIPINYDMGSIMISYTDGPNAKYWQSKSSDDEKLVKMLHSEIHKLFPDIDGDIPYPTIIRKYYWSTGACYYKKKSDPNELKKIMVNPMENVYFLGDTFSNHQAWMEGALESSENVLKIL